MSLSLQVFLLFGLFLVIAEAGLTHKVFNQFLESSKSLRSELATNQSTCQVFQCAANGAVCGENLSTNTFTLCNAENDYCSIQTGSITGKCVPFITQGNSCNPLVDVCAAGLGCVSTAIGFQCQPNNVTAYPGESCNSNSQCFFFNFTGTTFSTNSTCVNGTCFGQGVGEFCDSTFGQCLENLWCDTFNSVCRAELADGSPCNTSSQCIDFCVPVNQFGTSSQCEQPFSVASGGFCAFTFNCGDGLFCSYPNDTATIGTCQATLTSSGTACTTNNDCGFPQTCVCNPVFGNSSCTAPAGNIVGLSSATTSLTNCLVASNCSINSTTCVTTKCGEQICNYVELYYSNFEKEALALPCFYGVTDVTYLQQCLNVVTSTTSGASYNGVSFATLLAITVAAVALLL